jgi:hypothetical protein
MRSESEVQACDPVGANSDSPYLLWHNEEETLPERKKGSCIINFKGQKMSHFHYSHPQSNRTVMEVGTDNDKYVMAWNSYNLGHHRISIKVSAQQMHLRMCTSTVLQKSLWMILSRIIGVHCTTIIALTHIHIHK